MKINRKVWLTNSTRYACGDSPRFYLMEAAEDYMASEGWVELSVVEFDADLDRSRFAGGALDTLDAKETELREQYHVKLKEIESARNDLKALTWEKTA